MVQINLFTKQKYSHRCRKQTHGYCGEGGNILGLTKTHTIYKIDDKDLLYSTGNSIQYSVMAYIGKESKKEWIYVCV